MITRAISTKRIHTDITSMISMFTYTSIQYIYMYIDDSVCVSLMVIIKGAYPTCIVHIPLLGYVQYITHICMYILCVYRYMYVYGIWMCVYTMLEGGREVGRDGGGRREGGREGGREGRREEGRL